MFVKIFSVVALLSATTTLALTIEQVREIPRMGVDAEGRHYVARGNARTPWLGDTIFAPRPGYPVEDLHQHHEGIVVIRLDIDLKTGKSTYFTLLKSSGFPNLDEVAVRALTKWRFKPGRWKQVEIPVVFTFHRPDEFFDYSGPGHP